MEIRQLIFFTQEKESERQALLIEKPHIRQVDTYADQVKDFEKIQSLAGTPAEAGEGVWVYYPWREVMVHILPEEAYKIVRLSRNEPLITKDEQKKFAAATLGFAGLNVGNPGAVCTAQEGGGARFKLADLDPLDVSNMNRFRASLADLGVNKATLTARQIHEIDPFVDIELYEDGIQDDNIARFFDEPKIDVLVEEMDNLPLKIKIREEAKKRGVPVVMVTGNGAGLIVDIERYDLDPDLPILNGLLPDEVRQGIEAGPKEMEEFLVLARDFMDARDELVPRLRDSFSCVGKTLAGIPQIAEASFLRGALLAYCIRRIVVHGDLQSGRYNLQLDDIL